MEKSVLPDDALRYFISEKAPYCVVTLSGNLSRLSAKTLEQCEDRLSENASRFERYVLCLRGVSAVDYLGIAALVRLQQTLRKSGAELRVCSMSRDIERVMNERGALRREEVAVDLVQALKSLSKKAA